MNKEMKSRKKKLKIQRECLEKKKEIKKEMEEQKSYGFIIHIKIETKEKRKK
jgi:hypothetical protein